MDTIELPQDFKEFLRLLDSAKIEYLLIGGYAVGYHGYPRATGDLDIWVGINDNNAAAMVSVLQAFGFSTASLSAEPFLKERQVVRIGFPPVRIDLTTSVTGLDFVRPMLNVLQTRWTAYPSRSSASSTSRRTKPRRADQRT